jgi:hypothetical protein
MAGTTTPKTPKGVCRFTTRDGASGAKPIRIVKAHMTAWSEAGKGGCNVWLSTSGCIHVEQTVAEVDAIFEKVT